MPNQLTITASLAYSDSKGVIDSLAISNFLVTITTEIVLHTQQLIGTSESAIGLGSIATLGYGFFVNRDASHYIDLRIGTGAVKWSRLYPGMLAVLPIGPGITAPFAIADTAACWLEYLLASL